MGKQIKSTAITMDVSSMSGAPVAPSGAMRMRPKSDGTTLQLSYNGGAYFDMGAGGGGSTPRLDQVLDPTLNSTFAMTVYNLEFTYTGSTGVNDFIIQSDPNASGAGSLLFVRTQATTSTKSPLRVEANDVYAFGVLANGSTLIGNTAAQTLTNTALSGTISYFDQNLTVSPASNSTTEHRLLDQGVTFGTAFNAGSLRLRYAAIDHNVAATLSSFYIDNVTYTQSAGTTTTLNGYAATLNVNAGTSSTVLGSATSINAAGGTISSSIGFYSLVDQSSGTFTQHTGFKLFASGTIGTLYGCVMPSGSLSGFGIDPPTATLHASGTVRLDLSSDARGDVFYRASTGNVSRLAIGTSTQILTVTDIGGGILEPRWAAAPGGGGAGTPGGSATELQYRTGSTTFGGVTNTAVSGANITMGGTLTLDAASVADQKIVASAVAASDTNITFTEYRTATTPILLQFDRAGGTAASPANILNNYVLTELRFRGRLAGAFAQQAYIRALYTTGDLGSLQLGVGATSGSGTRLELTVNSGLGLFDAGGNSFTVSGSGFAFSHGATGAIYYRSAGGLFTALTIGSTSTYLKGGTIPSWGGIDAGHITAGLVPIARGGTNTGTTPANGRLLIGNGTDYAVANLTQGTGITITNSAGGITIAASAGSLPAGTGTEIQYRSSASAFGAVSNSGVSGANVTFGGSLTTDRAADANFKWTLSPLATDPSLTGIYNSATANPILIDFQRARGVSTNLNDEDVIGRIKFQGRVGGSLAEQCRIDGRYDADEGGGVLALISGTTTFNVYKASGFYSTYTTANTNTIQQTSINQLDSSGTPAAGLGQRQAFWLESSTTTAQVAAAQDVRWQNATHTTRSAVMTFRTAHKAQTATNERMVLGGYKDLTDNTLTDLFTVTFAAGDQLALGGEIHMLFVHKQVAGSLQIAAHRRKLQFVIAHLSNNVGYINIRETGVNADPMTTIVEHTDVASTSLTSIFHAVNADTSKDIASPILHNSGSWNAVTYKLQVDSPLTTISQLCVFYNIIYHGEADITLAA